MEDQHENMLRKIRKEEKKSKKRMFVFSTIPFGITIILVLISFIVVTNANKQVQELRQEKEELEETINKLNNEVNLKSDTLAEMKKTIELAVNYKDKRYSFDYTIDKNLYSRYPKQTSMLTEMRDMIENNPIKWHLGGFTVESGFDSPSFATYMINKYAATSVEISERYQIRDILPSVTEPEVGDIVFYENGYAMFYFEYRNEPFVVGMTPIGLASLTFDFGPRLIGFGKVNY